MRNFYIGWSKADLETALRSAQEDLAEGSVVTEGGAGDATFTREAKGNIQERIQRLLYALYLIDPITYPAQDCAPATRTQVVFTPFPA